MASTWRRWRARRSDCLYSSSQSRPSQRRPSKMDWMLASVLRSTSVSSRRRTMIPPLWRAKSQLKMKVRALPTCRKPVGEGAKRTRGVGERLDSGIALSIHDASIANLWTDLVYDRLNAVHLVEAYRSQEWRPGAPKEAARPNGRRGDASALGRGGGRRISRWLPDHFWRRNNLPLRKGDHVKQDQSTQSGKKAEQRQPGRKACFLEDEPAGHHDHGNHEHINKDEDRNHHRHEPEDVGVSLTRHGLQKEREFVHGMTP